MSALLILLLLSLTARADQPIATATDGPHAREAARHTWDPLPRPAQPVLAPPALARTPSATVLGFLPWWVTPSAWRRVAFDQLSHVAWFALELDADGAIVDRNGWPQGEIADSVHAAGAKLLATACLFDGGALRSLLGSAAHRARARVQLLHAVVEGAADGLMVDFEGLPHDQLLVFPAFLEELRQGLDSLGGEQGRSLELMTCTPAVDWNAAYRYTRLSDICDALFIMAYDYHWSGSGTSGPVAPATGWGTYNVEWSITDHLRYNGQRPDKLVLGLPWYGYEWPCATEAAGSATSGIGTARSLAAAAGLATDHGLLRETAARTPWTRWSANGWRQCWFDDTTSLGGKLRLARDAGLQGVGIWALGYEGLGSGVWRQLADWFPPVVAAAPRLRARVDGNSLWLEWDAWPGAEAYQVWQAASPWAREEDWRPLAATSTTFLALPRSGAGGDFYRVSALPAGRVDQVPDESGRPAGDTAR